MTAIVGKAAAGVDPARLVVYTAYYGRQEPLNQKVFGGFETCRWVVFTDDPHLEFPGAEVIHDPLDGLDAARASRRSKLLPHRYFPEAEWSIYLDNKSQLLADPVRIVTALAGQSGAGFFAFPHFRRDCVYQEGQTVWENGLDDFRVVKERMRTYRSEGLPEHAGLIEGHFIVRRHNAPDVVRFDERWFEHVLAYSRRDQISFPYLAWRTGFRYQLITDLTRAETVRLTVYDRKARRPDFPRKHLAYQRLRKLYHALRRRAGKWG